MRGTVAATDSRARPLPLRVLPAALRARIGMPQLRGALDDRADVEHGDRRLQSLRRDHVAGALRMSRLTERHVAPSILSADFSRLGAQVGEVLAAGARVIHVDVMDGHFVPPITFGAVAVGAIADQVHQAGGIIDVHLMIERPERHVEGRSPAPGRTTSPSTSRPRPTCITPWPRSARRARAPVPRSARPRPPRASPRSPRTRSISRSA